MVDNDPRIVEASLALLTRLGHRAYGAGDYAGALARLAETRIDAMLVDYHLDHGEDGLSLVEQVRMGYPALPAILITAETNAAIRQRAATLGIDILAKPVSPALIDAFLARLSVAQIQP